MSHETHVERLGWDAPFKCLDECWECETKIWCNVGERERERERERVSFEGDLNVAVLRKSVAEIEI
jgi:hypothetical protein